MGAWVPQTDEDCLIAAYHMKMGGGETFREFPVAKDEERGNWPEGVTTRRVDAVRITLSSKTSRAVHIHPTNRIRSCPDAHGVIDTYLSEGHCEIIEARRELNWSVIGQADYKRDYIVREYNPPSITSTVVVERSEPGLEWVCGKHDVNIDILNPVTEEEYLNWLAHDETESL